MWPGVAGTTLLGMRGARSSAPWRHPALAPVYAAVLAFVAVLVASLLIGPATQAALTPKARPTVTVHAPRDGALRVEVRDAVDGTLLIVQDAGRTSAVGRPDLIDRLALPVPADGQICVDPPDGWVIVEPAPRLDGLACRSAVGDLVFRLELS
jgi:hypothetical protein